MDAFEYGEGLLHCEGVDLTRIAARFGTPAFVYSRRALLDHYDRLAGAFADLHPKICFAIKSCHNLHLLRLLREHGAAFDAVSEGEVRRAIEAGTRPADIVFAGVGKTEAEIAAAVELGVGGFNVESAGELDLLAAQAERAGKVVEVALRVNPDVDALTHPYTTTGTRETKFGIDLETSRRLMVAYRDHPWLSMSGVHVHIGSQVNSVEPYVQAIRKVLALIHELRSAGSHVELLDIGGGFGACYQHADAATPEEYARAIVPLLAGQGLRVVLEPGRFISANAAVLLTRTLYVKAGRDRRFVIVDAAMTDLLRPALYGAYHFVWPVAPGPTFVPPHHGSDLKLPGTAQVDIVGPVCESGDFLGKDRWLPPVHHGDLLAVFSAGAYGSVMSSQYNSRPRAPEVLVDGDAVRLIRRRETYDDLVAAERNL